MLTLRLQQKTKFGSHLTPKSTSNPQIYKITLDTATTKTMPGVVISESDTTKPETITVTKDDAPIKPRPQSKKHRSLFPKPVFDGPLLLEAFSKHGINPVHATKIWRTLIYQSHITDFKDIPNLPKKAYQVLEEEFVLFTSKIIKLTEAKDKSTTKMLIELQDGKMIETVVMRYGDVELDHFPEEEKAKRIARNNETGTLKFKSNKRATLCVSSQVGCAQACTFCSTGTMGLQGNLHAGEILEQLMLANRFVEPIRNIVFMGLGEPLDNFPSVLSAVRAMIDTSLFGLSPSRVSISTVGIVPRMYDLIREAPDVSLALSLHAPTQEVRLKIVPTAKAYHIDKIIEAMDAFISNQNATIKSANRKRHVLVEYVLIRDINDSETVAHQLGELLRDREVLLNVIPYNPTIVPFDYKAPTREGMKTFVDIVRNYGVRLLIRQTLGQDASSACGQLVIENNGNGCGSGENGGKDIEDILSNGSSSKSGNKQVVTKKRRAVEVEGEGDEKLPVDTKRHFFDVVFVALFVLVMALFLGRLVTRFYA